MDDPTTDPAPLSANKTTEAHMAFAGFLVLALGMLLLMGGALLYEAWVLLTLWGWFVTPAISFTPSYPQAIGFCLITGLVLAGTSPVINEDDAAAVPRRMLYVNLLAPTVVLGLGWLAQHWM
jgi:hypothetical protein